MLVTQTYIEPFDFLFQWNIIKYLPLLSDDKTALQDNDNLLDVEGSGLFSSPFLILP